MNKKMNKKSRTITLCTSELVTLIRQSLRFSSPQLNDKMSLKDIKTVINAAFEIFGEELVLGRGVRIGDIGSLYIDRWRSRNGTNPRTFEPMVLPDRLRVAFRPSEKYRRQINKNWPKAFIGKWKDESEASTSVD